MAVVTFNYAAWAARYPELAGSIAAPTAQAFFDEATLYCDNTDSSPVEDATVRAVLLNMLTAHIAAMNGFVNGVAPSNLVGHISSASEGSVSVSVGEIFHAGSAQWYAQTRYGAAYWAATGRYRLLQWTPGDAFNPDPYAGLC